jgi:hypothetical protein
MLSDEQFELLLGEAVRANFENELSAIPPREELEETYVFSARHDARMEKLFGETRRARKTRALRLRRYAAAALAAVAALSFVAALASPRARAAVASTLAQWRDGFVKFIGVGEGNEQTPPVWRPDYIPEGFAELDALEAGDITQVNYGNGDGDAMTFICAPDDGAMSVNSDGAAYSLVTAGDADYHVLEALDGAGENAVVWAKGGYRFELFSTLPAEELLSVASSVGK